jgi:hypothetical protein
MTSGLYWASACLAVVIGVFALDIMGLFNWKNHLDVDGKVWFALSMRQDENVRKLTHDCRLSCLPVDLLEWAAVLRRSWHKKEQTL